MSKPHDPTLAEFLNEELEKPFEHQGGRSIDAEGNVEGRLAPSTRPVTTPTPPPVPMEESPQVMSISDSLESTAPPPASAFRAPDYESLELAHPVRHADRAPEETQALPANFVGESTRRRKRGIFIAAAAVLVIAGAAVLALPALKSSNLRASLPRAVSELPFGLAQPPAGLLLIDSEPGGATVIVGGKNIGTTPIAMDNVWPVGSVEIEVRKKGYKPWTGVFQGRDATQLNVTLKR